MKRYLAPVAGLALVVGLSGCGGSSAKFNISKTDVETQTAQQLAAKTGEATGTVSCPKDLPAAVDQKMTCKWTKAGESKSTNVQVKVTSVDEANQTAKFGVFLPS